MKTWGFSLPNALIYCTGNLWKLKGVGFFLIDTFFNYLFSIQNDQKLKRADQRLTENSRGHTEAVVLRDVIHLVFGVDGVVVSQFEHLLEGIVDEDEADKTGEALLREAGEVLDQEAGVGGHERQAEERRPQADPQAKL